MSKYDNFQNYLEGEVRSGNRYATRFLKDGKNALLLAIAEAKRKGLPEELIQRVEDRGMLDGSFEVTYEGAQRIYDKVRAITEKTGVKDGRDYLGMFDSFDPTTDHDLIATGIFCLIPEVRDYVKSNDALYKVALAASRGKRVGYSLPIHHRPDRGTDFIPQGISDIVSSLPKPQTDEEAENQRKLKVLLDKKVERETFQLFRKDPSGTIEDLEKRIEGEQNQNLREAYERLHTTYSNYMGLDVPGVNQEFVDPNTGETGVLPSLHQRSALYHLSEEKKLGVFDGCGTGKTAIATLAAPIIEEKLGRKPKVLVVCPNPAKRAWKKGLIGDETQRYLEEPQDVMVVNGERKDEEFLRRLDEADWVVVNYEQLISQVEGSDGLFVDELRKRGFDYTIYDEGHHIKSHRRTTKKGRPTLSAAAQDLAASSEYVSILTASPIADKLDDYGVLACMLQPEKFPSPETLKEAIGKNPRVLYTFFNEKSVRRTAEDINDELDWVEREELVDLTPEQRTLYEHIVEFRPSNWLIQARKALLDPRLVDPEIQRRAGVEGQLTEESSAKYQRLEEMLGSPDGPIARGDKFVLFSSMFREGVTRSENSTSLEEVLSKSLSKKLGRRVNIGIIDGMIPDVEDRERVIDDLSNGLDGILCTTETGGESLDFTDASYAVFLDEDYTPKTTEQALSRVVRKGQKKKVEIAHLRAAGTLDESLRDYVEKKRIVTKTAMDGHPLTSEEWKLLEDTEGKRLVEMVKKGVGGTSIDTYQAEIESIDDFETKKRVSRSRASSPILTSSDFDTTDAQRIAQWIGLDPINCWNHPEFIDLYMRTLPNLSVPIAHRAKISDLIRRAREGQIEFPRSVLSDGSGPSLLYEAYRGMKPLVVAAGYKVPIITDRDFSENMLAQGSNKRQIHGNMNGDESTIRPSRFDMVDNESISLLPNEDEVKKALLESHRILKQDGILELGLQNMRFSGEFYSGMEQLGFEVLTEKNQGFGISRDFFTRLKEAHGEHFAESYAAKLANTYMLIARKTDTPDESADASNFWFERTTPPEEPKPGLVVPVVSKGVSVQQQAPTQETERSNKESKEKFTGGTKKPSRVETGGKTFTPSRTVTIDPSGVVVSVKKTGGKK